MKGKVYIATCLVSLLAVVPVSTWAVGGSDADPANQIGKDTAKCQAAVSKLSLKFATQIVKGISRCFDGVIKCDQSANATEHDECIGKLLVLDRGRCAVGKLGGTFPYFGPTSSISVDALSKTTIGRAYFRFIDKLGHACIDLGVDLSITGTGLGLDPTPAIQETLAEALNSNVDGRGVACSAHRLLNDAYPLLDEVVDILQAHPDIGNAAASVGILNAETPPLSDCR